MGAYSIAAGGGLIKPRTVYPNMGLTSPYIYGALVPIATGTGNGTSPVIGFNSIPQTYQDLLVICNLFPSSTAARGGLQLNNDGSSIYSWTYLSGNGATPSGGRGTNTGWLDFYAGTGMATAQPTTVAIHILNYTSTSTFKAAIMKTASDQNGSGITQLSVGTYRSTSAISALSISTLNGSYLWNSGSTATVYGIRAANS